MYYHQFQELVAYRYVDLQYLIVHGIIFHHQETDLKHGVHFHQGLCGVVVLIVLVPAHNSWFYMLLIFHKIIFHAVVNLVGVLFVRFVHVVLILFTSTSHS